VGQQAVNRQKRRAEQTSDRAGRIEPRRQALALRQQGRLAEATVWFRRALRDAPDDAETHNNLGVTLQQQGLLDDAIAAYRQAIECRPGFAGAHDNLGVALTAMGAYEAAIEHHRRAIALTPQAAPPHNHLGLALMHRGARAAAIACYRRALQLQANFVDPLNNLGLALQEQADLVEAIACYRQAIEKRPDFAAAYANLGVALQEQGLLDESFAAFETAVALAPRHGAFQRMLIETGRVTPESAAWRRLESLEAEVGALPESDRLEIHFALGSAYAGFSQVQRAFPHLLEANRLHRRRIAYDEAATLARFETVKRLFSADRVAQQTDVKTRRPIFVVGMPRSGTTLVEQILASHPSVYGAGELPDLHHLVARAGGLERIASLGGDTIAQLGADYLAGLPVRGADYTHIVDKQPENFLHIGLIHMALPGARIIHVMRDPIDTCLSCFSKQFNAGVAYSYDLAELGRYYRVYCDLMAHWRDVLRPGAMLEVRYEDVVTDLESESRRLIAYLDLPWDSACLAFDQNRRPVRTASATQVRRQIYKSSMGRWKEVFTQDLGQTSLQRLLVNFDPKND
jgi:tetratricopeptide (TPR) repeat protein